MTSALSADAGEAKPVVAMPTSKLAVIADILKCIVLLLCMFAEVVPTATATVCSKKFFCRPDVSLVAIR